MPIDEISELPDDVRQYSAIKCLNTSQQNVQEYIAEEVPIALVYNGISHAVMLATPRDLEDFAIGFSLSEEIVKSHKEIYDIELDVVEKGVEVRLTIASEQFSLLKERRRSIAGRTGCGLCGTESIDFAIRALPELQISQPNALRADSISQAFSQLFDRQKLHSLTGAVHAAAWADFNGEIQAVREDVGRHNALDKLIGTLAKANTDFDNGFVLLTSRASSEMVQKSALVGINIIAAVSAPTGLAIRLAEKSRLTLMGFVRNQNYTIYATPDRLIM